MDTVGASAFGARFDIVGEAGSGGMGKVYEALDRHTHTRVAIKVLTDSGDRERFAREVAILESLEHEAIVKHVGHGDTAAGLPFLAMQWLAGESLSKRLERGPLAVVESLGLGVRIAGALAYAHAAGVIHRDLKPSNVYLVDGAVDRACVIDFGIAKTQAADLTTTGQMIGTPGYMAPEQVRGERTVDRRVDVFALGCVLYETLVGESPFEGGEVMEVLSRLLLERPRAIAELVPGAPPRLGFLLDAMLAKNATHRLADCSVVRDELLAIAAAMQAGDTAALEAHAPAIPIPPLDGKSSRPSIPTQSAPTQVERPSAKRERPSTGQERPKRRWIWLALTIVCAVIGGAVGATLVLRGGEPTTIVVEKPVEKPVEKVDKPPDKPVAKAGPCDDDDRSGCANQCEKGDAAACWLDGNARVASDPDGALAAYARSCTLGGIFGCSEAGLLLLEGKPDAKDIATAKEHLDRGCRDGDSYACLLDGEQARPSGMWPDATRAFRLVGGVCDNRHDDEFRGQACGLLLEMLAQREGDTGQRGRAKRIAENACRHGVKRACR